MQTGHHATPGAAPCQRAASYYPARQHQHQHRHGAPLSVVLFLPRSTHPTSRRLNSTASKSSHQPPQRLLRQLVSCRSSLTAQQHCAESERAGSSLVRLFFMATKREDRKRELGGFGNEKRDVTSANAIENKTVWTRTLRNLRFLFGEGGEKADGTGSLLDKREKTAAQHVRPDADFENPH